MSMNIGTDYKNYTSNYGKTSTISGNETKTESTEKTNSDGVIYEKSGEKSDNSTYKINKMSAADREKVVSQLNQRPRNASSSWSASYRRLCPVR